MKVSDDILAGLRKSTLREKWAAFSSIFRLARREASKHGNGHDLDAVSLLRVVFPHRWVDLASEPDDRPVSRVHYPTVIRWQLLAKYMRELESLRQRNRLVAGAMAADKLIEVTPSEVAAVREKVLRFASDLALQQGIPWPKTTTERLDMVFRSMKKDGYE